MGMGNSMILVVVISWLVQSAVVCSRSPLEELKKPYKAIDPKVVEMCMRAASKKTCESAYYMAGGENEGVTPEKVVMKQIEAARVVASWLDDQLGHAKKLSPSQVTCKKSLKKMVASTAEAEEGARMQNSQMVKQELGMAMGHVVHCEEAINGDNHYHQGINIKYATKVLQELVDNCITLADNNYAYAK